MLLEIQLIKMCRFYTFQEYFKILQVKDDTIFLNNISKISF